MSSKQNVRLLLTTVFGPYGVKTPYADDVGMQMELLNNQITREQGIHSPRVNYWTFPLYFLAENISVPTIVLDFPKWKDFKRELEKGYTHVGISFIQMNIHKVRRMAIYIRKNYPEVTILLGGYGTSLPNLSELTPYDEVCKGEGIRWLREYFGEDPDTPIKHPIMCGVTNKHLYGFKDTVYNSAVLFPGLGCPNKCFFCATSSKYNHEYIPFLHDGKEVFSVCLQAEKEKGIDGFAIIDENFLKGPKRARELLMEMEKHMKLYCFAMFSSAEAIIKHGIDFLVRMGVSLVWIGVESKKVLFDKVRDINVKKLIKDLQDHGISVIASSILFLEHHDRKALEEDINWAIDLNADLHQFMQLVPLPGTPLYKQYVAEGKMLDNYSYKILHGQNSLVFRHPYFKPHEARELTRYAFRKKYYKGGPAIINMIHTALKGYVHAVKDHYYHIRNHLTWNPVTLRYEKQKTFREDIFMKLRILQMKERIRMYRIVFPAARLFAPNRAIRRKIKHIHKLYNKVLGRESIKWRLLSIGVIVLASFEWMRIVLTKFLGHHELVRQPSVRRVEYH